MDKRSSCWTIGIAGASGAGKSHLALQLSEQLRARSLRQNESDLLVPVITEDCYYHCQSELEKEQRRQINFDHPDSIDHDLLASHLRDLRSGESIEMPQYDYVKHVRGKETVEIAAPRVLILEGILILTQPELRDCLDLKVFVDVPLDLCLERRIERDVQQRGRTRESVVKQFEATVRPMYREFIEPCREHADLVVPMYRENPAAIEMLVDHLAAHL